MLGFKNKLKKMKEAIDAGNLAYIADARGDLDRSDYYNACLYAIEKDSPATLKVVLEKNGFDFSSGSGGDRSGARALINIAKRSRLAEEFLSVFAAENAAARCTTLPITDFLHSGTSINVLQGLLEKKSGEL